MAERCLAGRRLLIPPLRRRGRIRKRSCWELWCWLVILLLDLSWVRNALWVWLLVSWWRLGRCRSWSHLLWLGVVRLPLTLNKRTLPLLRADLL